MLAALNFIVCVGSLGQSERARLRHVRRWQQLFAGWRWANYFACGFEYGPGWVLLSSHGFPRVRGRSTWRHLHRPGAGGHIDNENANIDDVFDAANNELFFSR